MNEMVFKLSELERAPLDNHATRVRYHCATSILLADWVKDWKIILKMPLPETGTSLLASYSSALPLCYTIFINRLSLGLKGYFENFVTQNRYCPLCMLLECATIALLSGSSRLKKIFTELRGTKWTLWLAIIRPRSEWAWKGQGFKNIKKSTPAWAPLTKKPSASSI